MDAFRNRFLFSVVGGYRAVRPVPVLAGRPGAPLEGVQGGDAFPPDGTFGWTLCHPKVPSGGIRAGVM